ncbi:nuclear transport factor 2 family protein [Knoellia sp. p5-6-4]|uniref:nuclear transport factor 2 family protein n=1 Tax=unclassified Knoellia TaxID=2618719 RepID=UPI0023D9E741|nr:nuclear transport factor 2 family protein [Knoellia sp. p5-6-4]MDF2144604.1 nuclear transport factor 2 family protein [Knoellia sp. p5-6-4]
MAQLPTDDDLAVVQDCERALLTGAVRGDRTSAGLLIHQDFREVGASGRIWDRERVLTMMEKEAAAGPFRVDATDMAAVGLAPDVVLVTYETHGEAGHARRSSVWLRERGRWQLRHHQGTPVPPDGAGSAGA